jgi:hypothetical protein
MASLGTYGSENYGNFLGFFRWSSQLLLGRYTRITCLPVYREQDHITKEHNPFVSTFPASKHPAFLVVHLSSS